MAKSQKQPKKWNDMKLNLTLTVSAAPLLFEWNNYQQCLEQQTLAHVLSRMQPCCCPNATGISFSNTLWSWVQGRVCTEAEWIHNLKKYDQMSVLSRSKFILGPLSCDLVFEKSECWRPKFACINQPCRNFHKVGISFGNMQNLQLPGLRLTPTQTSRLKTPRLRNAAACAT